MWSHVNNRRIQIRQLVIILLIWNSENVDISNVKTYSNVMENGSQRNSIFRPERGFTDPETGTFIEEGITLKWCGPADGSCDLSRDLRIGDNEIIGTDRSGQRQSFASLEALQEACGAPDKRFWRDWSFPAYEGWCRMISGKGHHVVFIPERRQRGRSSGLDAERGGLAYINRQFEPLPGYDLVTDTDQPAAEGPPLYRHPTRPELTWCNRGRRPLWLHDLLRQGYRLADLRW